MDEFWKNLRLAINEFIAKQRETFSAMPDISGAEGPVTRASVERAVEEAFAERDLGIWDLWEQLDVQLMARFPDDYVYANNVVVAEDGSLYAIVNYQGKLYRGLVTLDNSTTAMLGELEEIEVTYTPVESRQVGAIKVWRAASGRRMYARVVSAAVLLRGGMLEIDSTELYDSFLAHIERSGQLPIASYWHLGDATRVGQTVYMYRDGKCLVDVGMFDDTELGNLFADHVEANPDFWGTSIEYYRTALPKVEEVAGTKLYVHREGIITSCDFLPEKVAASLFTGDIITTQRERRMAMTEAQRKLLESMGAGEEILDGLDGRTRAINETIEKEGLISREAADEGGEEEAEEAAETAPAFEFVLDEATIGLIADEVAKRIKAATPDDVAAVSEELAEIRSVVNKAAEDAAEALKVANRSDKARTTAIAKGMPTQIVLRGAVADDEDEEEAEDPRRKRVGGDTPKPKVGKMAAQLAANREGRSGQRG